MTYILPLQLYIFLKSIKIIDTINIFFIYINNINIDNMAKIKLDIDFIALILIEYYKNEIFKN